MVNVIFAYVGMDIVAATASESKALNAESMKMAARKISIRIVTLYVVSMITASFVVPRDHPFINGKGQSVGSHSIFIIAVVEAGLPSLAHFFNAIFALSSVTCAINSMYVASRVLHTLALQDQTGPDFITHRLRQCRSGVPVRAILLTAAVMLIGFMGRTGSPGVVCLYGISVSKLVLTVRPAIERACCKLHCFVSDCIRHNLRNLSLFLQNVRSIPFSSSATFN